MTVEERKTVFEAWLASAELPYEELVLLFHHFHDAETLYQSVLSGDPFLAKHVSANHLSRLTGLTGRERLNHIFLSVHQYEIRSVNLEQETYPERLRNILDPPVILFYIGEIRILQYRRIAAMVGSRAASYAGLKAARTVARNLSLEGVAIVSGLAFGIDSESHCGCLEGGSPTVAVFGCGLDRVYPARNERLYRDILKNSGLILSEYAPGVRPYGYHFPVRNRIISGLSDAVILMEAKVKSGSMSTVDHALKQGREVFVYPGDPVSPMSEGNRALLRDGGRYFSTARDILEDMNWLDNPSVVGQNSVCHAASKADTTSESAVVQALEKGSLGFEQLISVTGLSSSELMSTLTMLSLKGLVESLPGKRYMLRS